MHNSRYRNIWSQVCSWIVNMYCMHFEGYHSCMSSLFLTMTFAADRDECAEGRHHCRPTTSVCVNLSPFYKCVCKPGYTKIRGRCKGKNCKKCIVYGQASLAASILTWQVTKNTARRFLYRERICRINNALPFLSFNW